MRNTICLYILSGLLSLYFMGCDDNIEPCPSPNACLSFESFKTDVTFHSQEIRLKFLDMDGIYPKDWYVEFLGFTTAENPEMLNYKSNFFEEKTGLYPVLDEYVDKSPDGLSFEWLSARHEISEGKAYLVLTVNQNNSDKPRMAAVTVKYSNSNHPLDFMFGTVYITQTGREDSEPFEMKVRYKGKIYSSPAHHDENGEIVMEDENFRLFMENLESRPGIEAVVMDDEIVDYFDNSDDEEKSALTALRQSVGGSAMPEVRLSFPPTRADAFRYMGRDAVGYFAVFDDSGYTDSHIAAGFTKFTRVYIN